MEGNVAIGRPGVWFAVTALVLVLAALGCGSSSPLAVDGGPASIGGNPNGLISCTISQHDGGHTVTAICIEGTATLRATIQAACAHPDAGRPPGTSAADAGHPGSGVSNTGHFAQAPCSHDGAVGGCTSAFGGNSRTNWYYAALGVTAAQVQQTCTMIGASFVAP